MAQAAGPWNTGRAGAINHHAAPKRMLLHSPSRPFHPNCDGSRRMPIPGACSPDLQGPVVAPLPGPRSPSTPQRTWKYWHRANPSADAIEFRAQMQVTPAKAAHFRNTTRSPSRRLLPCPFGIYLQRAHGYACSHTEPAACLLELACSLKLSRPCT